MAGYYWRSQVELLVCDVLFAICIYRERVHIMMCSYSFVLTRCSCHACASMYFYGREGGMKNALLKLLRSFLRSDDNLCTSPRHHCFDPVLAQPRIESRVAGYWLSHLRLWILRPSSDCKCRYRMSAETPWCCRQPRFDPWEEGQKHLMVLPPRVGINTVVMPTPVVHLTELKNQICEC